MVAERRKAFCYPNASSPRKASDSKMPRRGSQGEPPVEAGFDAEDEAFASSVEDDEQLTGKLDSAGRQVFDSVDINNSEDVEEEGGSSGKACSQTCQPNLPREQSQKGPENPPNSTNIFEDTY